jgi:hypothetical protein
MKFGVITEVPPLKDSGNLAVAFGEIVIKTGGGTALTDYRDTFEDIGFPASLALHKQVFRVGEVLILNDDGREIPYPGRKPAKWSVTCEEFDNVEAAVARAREVMDT